MDAWISLHLPLWSIDRHRRTLARAERVRREGSVGVSAAGQAGAWTHAARARTRADVDGAEEQSRAPERAVVGHGVRAPIVLASTIGQRQMVGACCERAAKAGVRVGMTLAHARALLPPEEPQGKSRGAGLIVANYMPARDRAALLRLGLWFTRLAPRVAIDEPDGLILDVSGCEALYGGPERIVRRIGGAARRLGLTADVALAGTIGCAWALARHAPGEPGSRRVVVPPGCEARALERVPLAGLRLSPACVLGLAEVAVDRVGELGALPRDQVGRRFGAGVLARLDQAMGRMSELIDPVRVTDVLRVERVFAGPTTHAESVEFGVRDALRELCEGLSRSELGLRRLEVRADRRTPAGLETCATTLTFSAPTRSLRHLGRMIRGPTERLHMGLGIERIELVARRTSRLSGEQASCTGPDAADSKGAGELMDTLAARLGPARVCRSELRASRVPERGAVTLSLTHASEPRRDAGDRADNRPTLLLESPERARVLSLTPDGPPVAMHWRGERRELVHAIGPERVACEWWTQPGGTGEGGVPAQRDYFRVCDRSGRWLWVFRASSGEAWFVHGVWG